MYLFEGQTNMGSVIRDGFDRFSEERWQVFCKTAERSKQCDTRQFYLFSEEG